MKNAQHYWSSHITAIKSQGGTASDYARRHDLALASLYYWKRKLQLAPTALSASEPVTAPKISSKFVSLRVRDPVQDMAQSAWPCTLVFAGGMRLEMSALPDPKWLAAVQCGAQGGH